MIRLSFGTFRRYRTGISHIRIHSPQTLTTSSVRLFANAYSYSTISTGLPNADELNTYETFLRKHNQSLKKPHQKLRTEQQRIVKQYLSTQRYSELIQFASRTVDLRLCNISTTPTLDRALAQQYACLSATDKVEAAFALVSFREQRVFKLLREEVERKMSSQGIQSLGVDELIVYLYGQVISYKNMGFLRQRKVKGIPQDKIVEAVRQALVYRQYRGSFRQQLLNLQNYLNLLLHPSDNKVESSQTNKKRSILEKDIESFLNVLGHRYVRQARVNGYGVDYLLTKKQGSKQSDIALEVNGSYHYTLQGKIKGREVLRNVIVNQCVPLRIIHHQDYLLSKGYRNKLAYIEEVVAREQPNWECVHQGMDSGWQVTETDDVI